MINTKRTWQNFQTIWTNM